MSVIKSANDMWMLEKDAKCSICPAEFDNTYPWVKYDVGLRICPECLKRNGWGLVRDITEASLLLRYRS